MTTTTIVSPLGPIKATAQGGFITQVSFSGVTPEQAGQEEAESLLLDRLRIWLSAYFEGRNPTMDLPLAPSGTEFQIRVWDALRRIPHGSTCSYETLTASLGNPLALRAVATANGRNPIAILVPCHRVIGKDGSLTGYAGGLERKRALLMLEAGLSEPDLWETIV